ncbi:SURF1 family protein [Pseudoxanthomonas sp. PXM02]|uniref:SURF1 family protein n=1 Tax=Pseudoxanthomonas sp. PXM02 TaxID=2769294 RepID=UPI001781CA7A|nr:SURF1 family protein [Pseudoxanthomonas sp. PXM02]MBD9480417.1 SURF1 family protein [Pseudoxanthomonas sp. PXM02]
MSRRMPLPVGWTLAVLAMSLFGSLGAWQWGRAEQKEAMLAETTRVLAERQPQPLASAADKARSQAYDWAAGEGEFLPAPALLLDNQTRDRQPGVRVYRVFQPASAGAPLLVELGWLPVPGNRVMPAVAPLPGPHRVAGLLVPPPSEGIAHAPPSAQPDGSLLVIALQRQDIAQALGLSTLAPRVLKLDPDLPIGYARDLDILPNTLPPERHVGYAVQWFGLAGAVLVTALVLTWRSRRAARKGQ